jgi:superfamily II DNA or RNA helicase
VHWLSHGGGLDRQEHRKARRYAAAAGVAVKEKRQLMSGAPVPEDRSHTEIDPATGMQRDYVVLTAEERAKGFVKPVRFAYVHTKCRATTTMAQELAETYARNPRFYTGTFCVKCRAHFPLYEFLWEDGEPMDPNVQDQEQRDARA